MRLAEQNSPFVLDRIKPITNVTYIHTYIVYIYILVEDFAKDYSISRCITPSLLVVSSYFRYYNYMSLLCRYLKELSHSL